MAGKNGGIVWDETNGVLVTPTAECRYTYLNKPDSKFGDPTWRAEVYIDPDDDDWKALLKAALQFENSYRKSMGAKPVKKPSIVKTDDNSGRPFLKVTCKAKEAPGGGWRPIAVVDAKKNDVFGKVNVFGGDFIKVAFKLGGWQAAGKFGVKPYFNAAQVIEVNNEGGGNRADVFGEEDGFESDGGNAQDAIGAFNEEDGDDDLV